MKHFRLIGLCLTLACVLSCLTACGGNPESSTPSTPETTITTTTTTTPAPKEIPFTVKAMVRFQSVRDMSASARLLLSSSQVEEAKLNELTWVNLEIVKIDTSEYTDAYFADKALVLLYCVEPSGSSRIAIDTAVVKRQKLTVSYTTKTPMPATDDGAEWCILLEVNRADVADVTEIEGSRTEVTLPSGQKLE